MITGFVSGDNGALLKLRSIDARLRETLRAAVTRGAIMLTRYIKENKLSGQVLKNRTGTLRRKVNYAVRETPSSVTSSVGVKLSYAAAHEYGLDKVESVRAHLRHVKSRDVRGRNASGRYQGYSSQGVTYVGAHTRHMKLPERSFLRSSLRENAGPLMAMLRAAVAEASV